MEYSPIPLLVDSEFHHIGYATKSIKQEINFFTCLGYFQESPVFVDENQGIKGCFMVGDGPRIELLENLPSSKTLSPWLKKGINMYHFAYLVNDITFALHQCQLVSSILLSKPTPSVAFDGRKIAFVIFKNNFLVELIES